MDDELFYNSDYEFMRPLVTGWISKLEASHRSRKKWKEIADECILFYSNSARAMWDPMYAKKFWAGSIELPRFRLTINKSFEFVAIFGPNLFWDIPHRNAEPKRGQMVPQDLIPMDPESQMIYESLAQSQQSGEQIHRIVAHLMQLHLNYTPREQRGTLGHHSEMAIMDAMLKGRGVLASRPDKLPGSQRQLTGSFHEDPFNIFFDPDFDKIYDAQWMSIKHVDPHWKVERRFRLPANSLKGKASLESSWHYAEVQTAEGGGNMHRAAGLTNDLVVWYEIFSKCGVGARMTGMPDIIKNHLERVVGDHAYLCIAANVPYPLNCPAEAFRSGGINNKGATEDEIKERFSWPVPFWADDRWPVEMCDFYDDPNSLWPVPPMSPGLGELKFMNFLVPWLCNRIYKSSRDFYAVAQPHIDTFKATLESGADQTVVGVPHMVDDVRKAIQVLQQPETRMDAWRIFEMVSELFDKRVGLTETSYGRNEDGTQNRSAEETMAKARAVGVRPEFMQKKVVEWQSRVAAAEAVVARRFVRGNDIQGHIGPVGAWLWDKYVVSQDWESVARQMEYTIEASSIQRPNRDRDVANLQQVMQFFAPAQEQYGQATGNYQPWNGTMRRWGEMHNIDTHDMEIPPPPPPEPDPQAELDLQKSQMELQGKQIDLEGKQVQHETRLVDAQAKMQQAQIDLEVKQGTASTVIQQATSKLQSDLAEASMKLAQSQAAFEQDVTHVEEKHDLDLLTDAEKHEQEMVQMHDMGQVKIELARRQAAQKPKPPEKK